MSQNGSLCTARPTAFIATGLPVIPVQRPSGRQRQIITPSACRSKAMPPAIVTSGGKMNNNNSEQNIAALARQNWWIDRKSLTSSGRRLPAISCGSSTSLAKAAWAKPSFAREILQRCRSGGDWANPRLLAMHDVLDLYHTSNHVQQGFAETMLVALRQQVAHDNMPDKGSNSPLSMRSSRNTDKQMMSTVAWDGLCPACTSQRTFSA